MADPTSMDDWANLVRSLIPWTGGAGGLFWVYTETRKNYADQRKRDQEKIAEQQQDIAGMRLELRERDERLAEKDERIDSIQAKLNAAYKELYPRDGKDEGG